MTADVLHRDASAFGVFERDDEMGEAGHEQVVFCHDKDSGLRAIISIHDTTLGPALGGTRFYPYANEAAALTDALRLSQGMTYKAAASGMQLGGGKAVIIGDPATSKTPELLRAYGSFIDSLGGRYVSAADVGTTSDDLDVIGESTQHVVGRSKQGGGSGDSGFSTAFGVYASMEVAAERMWRDTGLRGRTVGVEGAGKVGFHLIGLLLDGGANVVLSDPHRPAVDRAVEAYHDIALSGSVIDAPVDIYAPCALGATLTKSSIAGMHARVVCGAANNQLLASEVDGLLVSRGILWVPDYVANAGGLIQVGGELQKRTEDEVLDDVAAIRHTVNEIIDASERNGTSTGVSAATIVEERLAAGLWRSRVGQ